MQTQKHSTSTVLLLFCAGRQRKNPIYAELTQTGQLIRTHNVSPVQNDSEASYISTQEDVAVCQEDQPV